MSYNPYFIDNDARRAEKVLANAKWPTRTLTAYYYQNGVCHACGKPLDIRVAQLDHVAERRVARWLSSWKVDYFLHALDVPTDNNGHIKRDWFQKPFNLRLVHADCNATKATLVAKAKSRKKWTKLVDSWAHAQKSHDNDLWFTSNCHARGFIFWQAFAGQWSSDYSDFMIDDTKAWQNATIYDISTHKVEMSDLQAISAISEEMESYIERKAAGFYRKDRQRDLNMFADFAPTHNAILRKIQIE